MYLCLAIGSFLSVNCTVTVSEKIKGKEKGKGTETEKVTVTAVCLSGSNETVQCLEQQKVMHPYIVLYYSVLLYVPDSFSGDVVSVKVAFQSRL